MNKVVYLFGILGAIGAGFSIVAMALLVSCASISRYALNKPWRFTEEISGALMVAIFFLPLLYVLVLDRHINVTLVFDRFNQKTRVFLMILNSFLSAAYAGFIFGEGMRLTNQLLRYNVKYMSVPLPQVISAIFIPIGSALFGLGCVALLLRQVLALTSQRQEVKNK